MAIKYLNILGREYAVFWYRKEIPGTEDGEWGLCQRDEGIISVRERLRGDDVETLLHEVLHAVWWEMGMAEAEEEEDVCRKLGSALVKVLRENPELMEYLREEI